MHARTDLESGKLETQMSCSVGGVSLDLDSYVANDTKRKLERAKLGPDHLSLLAVMHYSNANGVESNAWMISAQFSSKVAFSKRADYVKKMNTAIGMDFLGSAFDTKHNAQHGGFIAKVYGSKQVVDYIVPKIQTSELTQPWGKEFKLLSLPQEFGDAEPPSFELQHVEMTWSVVALTKVSTWILKEWLQKKLFMEWDKTTTSWYIDEGSEKYIAHSLCEDYIIALFESIMKRYGFIGVLPNKAAAVEDEDEQVGEEEHEEEDDGKCTHVCMISVVAYVILLCK